jgi:hypothetical protein
MQNKVPTIVRTTVVALIAIIPVLVFILLLIRGKHIKGCHGRSKTTSVKPASEDQTAPNDRQNIPRRWRPMKHNKDPNPMDKPRCEERTDCSSLSTPHRKHEQGSVQGDDESMEVISFSSPYLPPKGLMENVDEESEVDGYSTFYQPSNRDILGSAPADEEREESETFDDIAMEGEYVFGDSYNAV